MTANTVITTLDLANTTTAINWANLARMAALAIRLGVNPKTVAERIESALRNGFGHVSYNTAALAADIEDLSH